MLITQSQIFNGLLCYTRYEEGIEVPPSRLLGLKVTPLIPLTLYKYRIILVNTSVTSDSTKNKGISEKLCCCCHL